MSDLINDMAIDGQWCHCGPASYTAPCHRVTGQEQLDAAKLLRPLIERLVIFPGSTPVRDIDLLDSLPKSAIGKLSPGEICAGLEYLHFNVEPTGDAVGFEYTSNWGGGQCCFHFIVYVNGVLPRVPGPGDRPFAVRLDSNAPPGPSMSIEARAESIREFRWAALLNSFKRST